MGTITCGVFTAINTGYCQWKITCTKLPDWEQTIEAKRETAARAVIQLQAEFRGTWEVQK